MNPPSSAPPAPDPPGQTASRSTVARAVLRGALGFAAVSVAAFAVWAFGGRWFYRHVGEAGLYAACTLVFVGLSGLFLHPLVRGPRSLARFYGLFVSAFVAYAVVWSAAWFALHAGLGEWLASLAGSAVFAAVAGCWLGNLRPWLRVTLLLFVAHSVGYFLGGEVYYWSRGPAAAQWLTSLSKAQIARLGMLGWGLLYGFGFGAGIGYALFTFQRQTAAPAAVNR